MRNILNSWRWYTLGREQYIEYIRKMFFHNLYFLRQANTVVIVLASCWCIFPIAVEKNLVKAAIYLTTVLISLILAILANYKLKQLKMGKEVKSLSTYVLTTIYYANIILFGIYIGVWSNPNQFAVTFMSFLICGLLLFIYPPLYNLCLTLGALVVFITASILVKPFNIWVFDLSNVVVAGCISLFFVWHITKLRLVSALNTCRLEDERNKYYNQSTVDELTGLRNRRDFMQTFQRYLFNYRSSDDWLCIAVADIDFFKHYNDQYGHPKGDECLRSIGKILNSLTESMSVYAARVGGEEFALLWFEKDIGHINTVVSRVNNLLKDLNIPHEKSEAAPYVTISTGLYVIRCGTFSDMEILYDLADKALYKAKNRGRNCAIVSGSEITQYKIEHDKKTQ